MMSKFIKLFAVVLLLASCGKKDDKPRERRERKRDPLRCLRELCGEPAREQIDEAADDGDIHQKEEDDRERDDKKAAENTF